MYKTLLSIFTILFLSISEVNANKNIIKNLKEGGKIIFVRHALAPGSGDPENFDLNDCNTQRNLSNQGIKQSERLGLFFLKNQIPIDVVLSSEWCRCKDTAKYAFENYKTFSALNSFFSYKFQKNKNTQMSDLREYLKSWRSDKNLILVTHYVTILEIINKSSSSGEILITDSKLNLLGTITDY
tara:strand:- start:159 stop:710 length:552 start_codon:yes stop_codon:yes gene_type:complete